MKKNPLVSIIIPVYNEEKLVKHLLKKVNLVKGVKKEIMAQTEKISPKKKGTSHVVLSLHSCPFLFWLLLGGWGGAGRVGFRFWFWALKKFHH